MSHDEDEKVTTAKKALKWVVLASVVILALVAWFVSGWITDKSEENYLDRHDKKIEAEKSKQAEKTEDPSLDENDYPAPTEAPDEESDHNDLSDRPHDGDAEDEVDFGDKVSKDDQINYGEQNSQRMLLNTAELDMYVNDESKELDSLDDCYSTTKGYVVCPVSGEYDMIMDTFNQDVFGIIRDEGEFSGEDVEKFNEMFPEGSQAQGTGFLEGKFILVRGAVNDLS